MAEIEPRIVGAPAVSVATSQGGAQRRPGEADASATSGEGPSAQGDRAVLLLEESWGPAAMWDDWVISPVLEL